MKNQASQEFEHSVRIREAALVDQPQWDAYVSGHPLATPYHLFAWRQAMTDAYGLEAPYLIAEDIEENSLRGIFPAARVPRPLGRGRLCSLPYCDRGEPLADNHVVYRMLLRSIAEPDALAHELRGTAPEPDFAAEQTAPEQRDEIHDGTKVRMLLHMPGDASELEASFKSKLRSQIRKSIKNGLVADTGNDPRRVDDFYNVYAQNMRDLGSPAHSKRWFDAIARAYGTQCSIGIVRLDQQAVGAGMVLRCGDKAAIPWASTLKDYNAMAPNMLLYWTLLSEAADGGVRSFDFGRSTVGEGTFRFKRQWGSEPVPLRWCLVTNELAGNTAPAPAVATGRDRTRAFIEKSWRHLPLPLATTLGSTVRPYISL